MVINLGDKSPKMASISEEPMTGDGIQRMLTLIGSDILIVIAITERLRNSIMSSSFRAASFLDLKLQKNIQNAVNRMFFVKNSTKLFGNQLCRSLFLKKFQGFNLQLHEKRGSRAGFFL